MKVNWVVLVAMLVGAAALVGAAQNGGVFQAMKQTAAESSVGVRMPAFDGATTWLNSPPLTPEGLRGKVVLVDFWTYTCINWQRTLPYVHAWADKYRDHGLVVVGVHAPEFEFEKNLDNVRAAAGDLAVDYPIVVDSDHAIWRAFGNQYWPALYFVDAQGFVRHHQFGEGEYAKSEQVIQRLLAEAGARDVPQGLVSVEGTGALAAADWNDLKSPENYLGYTRSEGFASPGGAVSGRPGLYAAPASLGLNHWALAGNWTITNQATRLDLPNGRIVYRFHARDVHLVMGPATHGNRVRFRVLIDGKPPGIAHGTDVDAQGNGIVTMQRMYQLIRQPLPIDDRTFEIEFLDAGVEAFVFTFG
jgi:thiol-disulfide isomerase/thioredoxin